MNKIKALEEQIIRHKTLYYRGSPEISDDQYDNLEELLAKLHPHSKVLEMVGAAPLVGKKVKHAQKMLSLSKTYDEDELFSWIDQHAVISMFKVDGVSCSLIYENGDLIVAKTRGDGLEGENITAKVLWMESVPKTIKELKKVEIRGEMYCDEEHFFHLSEEMAEKGLEKPMSQRNIVAGLIGRKDHLELCRYIDFKAFDLIEDGPLEGTELDKIHKMKTLGLPLLDFQLHKNTEKISRAIATTADFMARGDFLIDGLVFTYNDLSLHEELGDTAHHPRYKMAFKFKGETKKTKILKIIWSVSRNGVLTPVAAVDPVELSGAKISRVTLHNYGLVNLHQLKEGDEIEIIRSGEVIPKFLSKITSSQMKFSRPHKCPSCQGKIKVDDLRLFCRNTSCVGRVKEKILYFIQKIGIDDLSSKRLDEFIKMGIIAKIADLYCIKSEDLLQLDKFKEKLATKIIASIAKSKDVDLITFLASLGIAGGAYNKCEKIVAFGFNSLLKIKKITVEQLMEIDSFALKSATDFHQSLKDHLPLIEQLEAVGFTFDAVESDNEKPPLSGQKICITGSLTEKRTLIEARIRKAGGIIVSSVTKNTHFLLTNETNSSSSKFKKAQSLGVALISEKKMREKIYGDNQ